MSNITKDQVIEWLSGQTVLDLAALVKDLEGKWGVSAAAAVAAAGPATAVAAVVEEKTEFNVILLEAQAGDGADFLDDADLVRAGGLEDDGELGLRLGRGSGSGSDGDSRAGGSGGGNAPLAFEIFDEGGEVEDLLRGQPLDDLVFGDVAHVVCSLGGLAVSKSETRLRDVSPSRPRWILSSPARAGKLVEVLC